MIASVVLASGSASRRAMFAAAGIEAVLDKPEVDESRLKHVLRTEGRTTEEVAMALARAKAEAVARHHPRSIVIGGDQMLDLDGEWLDKPADLAGAAEHLRRLSGHTHRLVSAVVAYRGGAPVWEAIDSATLSMRVLSPSFIDSYIAATGERILSSVGAYQVESLGIQLFEKIDGDHFTILGLPLLPLLDFLRREGALRS